MSNLPRIATAALLLIITWMAAQSVFELSKRYKLVPVLRKKSSAPTAQLRSTDKTDCANVSYVDHCASNPCKNGGACINFHPSFYCACHPGYHGLTCERLRQYMAFPKGNKPCMFIEDPDHLEKIQALDSLSYAVSFVPATKVDEAEKFDVVLNTFRRNSLLKVALANYLKCPRVASVRISWSDTANKPPARAFFDNVPPTRMKDFDFDVYDTDTLNNRFHPSKHLKQRAVFSVDDDMEYSCKKLDFSFRVWQDDPDSMVGFEPRIPFKDPHGGYRYVWNQALRWGIYNIVLVTKGGFMHKKYFDAYTYAMPASIREYVTKHLNCEDLAMSFLVANITNRPPVWIRTTGKAMKWNGRTISKNEKGEIKQHGLARNSCMNYLEKEFKRLPLVLAHRSIKFEPAV